LYNFLLQGWKSSSRNFRQSLLCNEPRKCHLSFFFFSLLLFRHPWVWSSPWSCTGCI
jgi:hypothetical protein